MLRPLRGWIVSLAFVCAAVPAVHADVVRHGSPDCHCVAITFDLCPVKSGKGFDEELVKRLIERHIHATFFASGQWMTSHEAALRELLAVPFFEVGTHGERHASLPRLTAEAQGSEILTPVTRLAEQFGRPSTLFRPPYGDFNATSVALAEAAGLKVVMWSVVSGDPDPKLTADAITRDVESRARAGSIIIFHANGRGWHTLEVIDNIYQHLIVEKGLTPFTVDELLACCGHHASPRADH